MMIVRESCLADAEKIAFFVAGFRNELSALKGIYSTPDIKSGA